MAAENHGRAARNPADPRRFNEAAAHGRGKLTFLPGRGPGRGGFNEAAAHGRGKRTRTAPEVSGTALQ